MAADEENCIEVIIAGQPILKPIDLKNIGFLQKFPTHLNCVACQAEAMSEVRREVVTCWQKFLKVTNMCKTAESRYDINHYCSICGCYIGRYVAIACGERYLSKRARKQAAADAMTLRKERQNCAHKLQNSREKVLANMAKERKEREKKQNGEDKVKDKDNK